MRPTSRATDLTNLPLAYIPVGALDLFIDENIEYAQYPPSRPAYLLGSTYILTPRVSWFDLFAPSAMVSKQFRANCDDPLRRALHGWHGDCALPV